MKLSKLQLGTVQFGLDYGIANTAGKPSYETAREIVKTAFEGGINCFDTASTYGDSEEVLGKILEELKISDSAVVVTKVSLGKHYSASAAEIEKFVLDTIETSLKKLRLDALPICLFHDNKDIAYIDCLFKARDKGLIKNAGISIDSTALLDDVLESEITFLQMPFNILDKRYEESDFFRKAKEKNIGIFCRSVYLQGLLLMPEDKIISHLAPVLPVRRELQKIAEEAGMEMPELCMRFLMSIPEVNSVLTGVDTLEQLEENLKIAEKGALPQDILDEINRVVPYFPENIVRPAFWRR